MAFGLYLACTRPYDIRFLPFGQSTLQDSALTIRASEIYHLGIMTFGFYLSCIRPYGFRSLPFGQSTFIIRAAWYSNQFGNSFLSLSSYSLWHSTFTIWAFGLMALDHMASGFYHSGTRPYGFRLSPFGHSTLWSLPFGHQIYHFSIQIYGIRLQSFDLMKLDLSHLGIWPFGNLIAFKVQHLGIWGYGIWKTVFTFRALDLIAFSLNPSTFTINYLWYSNQFGYSSLSLSFYSLWHST